MKIAQPVAYPLPEGHRRQPLMGIKPIVHRSEGVTLRVLSERFTENRGCQNRLFSGLDRGGCDQGESKAMTKHTTSDSLG